VRGSLDILNVNVVRLYLMCLHCVLKMCSNKCADALVELNRRARTAAAAAPTTMTSQGASRVSEPTEAEVEKSNALMVSAALSVVTLQAVVVLGL